MKQVTSFNTTSIAEKRLSPFIKKLWRIMNDCNLQSIIYWSEQGTTICISNSMLFCKSVLPHYFKHNNWHSFVRQLNLYGFRKVYHFSIAIDYASGRQETVWQFKHRHFRRGDEESLLLIHRKISSFPSSINKEEERFQPLVSEIEKRLDLAEKRFEEMKRETQSLRQQQQDQEMFLLKLMGEVMSVSEKLYSTTASVQRPVDPGLSGSDAGTYYRQGMEYSINDSDSSSCNNRRISSNFNSNIKGSDSKSGARDGHRPYSLPSLDDMTHLHRCSHKHLSMESSLIPGSYRPIVLICIGLWGWGLNLLLLCRQRIDPSYLLQIHHPSSSSTNDKRVYQSIFIIAGALSLIVLLNLWFYLHFVQPEDSSWLPLLAYLSAIVLLFWPGKKFLFKERVRFIRLFKRITSINLFANVYFADIIFADLLTSFSNVLGDMFLAGCIILPGKSNLDFIALESDTQNTYYRDVLVPLVISLPYFIRLRQCISEYIESGGETRRHLFNALKYATAFPVIMLSAIQKKVSGYMTETGSIPSTWWINESNLFRLWMMAVFINSMYSFWWDISMDWNLLQVTYEAPAKHTIDHHHHYHQQATPMIRFRRHLHFPSTAIYFLAMMADFILRITWGLKFSSHIYIKKIEGNVFLVELLEVVRRWIWVIFRMESEWVKRSSLPTTATDVSTSPTPAMLNSIPPIPLHQSDSDFRMDLLDRPKHSLLTPIHEEEDDSLTH